MFSRRRYRGKDDRGVNLYRVSCASSTVNEGNAVGGWVGVNCTVTADSGITPKFGTYAIKGVVTGGSGKLQINLENPNSGINLVEGAHYRYGFWARHLGSGGTIRCGWDTASGTPAGSEIIKDFTSTDTTFEFFTGTIQYTTAGYHFLIFVEVNAGNDGGVYVDGFSFERIS